MMFRLCGLFALLLICTACDSQMGTAKQVLEDSLVDKDEVEFEALKSYPGDVVCGMYRAFGRWDSSGNIDFRPFVFRDGNIDIRPAAKDRAVFGRPIGQNQGVQFPIAKAYANMRAAELVVKEALSLYEAGENPGAEANMAKMLAADASFEAANVCVQTHGGFGFAEEYDVERKFRGTRLYQVAPISTNLILSYLSEHILGLPRSY